MLVCHRFRHSKHTIHNYVFLTQALDFLPFEGKVNLKDPEHIFCLLEDYGSDPNNIPEDPFHLYFGRWVSSSFQICNVSECFFSDVC